MAVGGYPIAVNHVTNALTYSVTSSTPVDDETATAGTSGEPAAGDHVHPRYDWAPTDHGLLAWSADFGLMTGGGGTPSDGVLQLARLHLPVAASVTNVILYVQTAGTSLTANNNIAGLWTAAGVKVGVTADQSGTWNSTGLKTMALTDGPFSCAAGDYYVGWWTNGTGTDPAFQRTNVLVYGNAGLSAANSRFATADSGLTNAASAPATLGSKTASQNGWLAGLS